MDTGMKTVRDLKRNEWFTLKPIPYPEDKQVYVRGEYDRSARRYSCGRRDDISYSRLLKPDTIVFTDFIY